MSTSEMKALVDALVEAMVTIEEAHGDPEAAALGKKVLRKPASAEQLVELEEKWGRSLPPTYRTFLEVCNGLDNSISSHRLLGTKDQSWGKKQVSEVSEYWDSFDPKSHLPVWVPDGDDGISSFAAFVRSDDTEMAIVDWDNGREHERFDSFSAFLEHRVQQEERLARSAVKRAAKKKAPKSSG